MKKLKFTITINAPAEIVYNKMLGLDDINTYRQWTSEFNPSSTYEGSWEKNSVIHFFGTDSKGEKAGMVSEVAENIPGELVSIKHIGIIMGNTQITEGPEVESWAGALESYKFTEHGGVTTLTVECDTAEEHLESFSKIWPNALSALKKMVEVS